MRCEGPHFLIAGLVVLVCGCANYGKINETHYFAAYGSSGETNVYRVRIEGKSRNSAAKYRAGQFPADAVDAVFGELEPDTDPQTEIDTLRRAVSRTAQRYGDLLADEKSPQNDIDQAGRNYQRAIDALRERMKRNKDEEFLRKKFVFVYSTDPGDVIQAIQDFLSRQKLSKTLANLFQGMVIRDALVAREGFEILGRQRTARSAVTGGAKTRTAARKLQLPDDADSTKVAEAATGVAALANDLDTVAEALER